MLELIVDPALDEVDPAQWASADADNWEYKQVIEHIESMHGEEPERGKWSVYESKIPDDTRWMHDNLAGYIEKCWAYHAGIVFRPDMFYFTVYSEIAQYVVKNAEACRAIFTDKPYKQEIVIVQDTSQCIDFEQLIAALKEKVPTSIEKLLPDFSTDSKFSKEARLAAFAEAASPYYLYFTTLCGIKKVRLEGTEKDWASIETALKQWEGLLPGDDIKKYIGTSLEVCQKILGQVRAGKLDSEFWSKIFWDEHCGSGHPEYCGWLVDICNKPQKSSPFDLRGNITSVEWRVIGGMEEHFKVHHGLFSSKLTDDKFLVPEFSRIIFVEKKN